MDIPNPIHPDRLSARERLAEVTRIETDRLKDARTFRARITLRVLIEPA